MSPRETRVRGALVELADILRDGYPPEAMAHLEAIVKMARSVDLDPRSQIDGTGDVLISLDFSLDDLAERGKA